MAVVFDKPHALCDVATTYCPGCTHGIIHRLVAEVMDELGIEDPSDFDSLAEAARRYHGAYPDSSLFLDYSAMNTWMVNLPDLIQYAGIRFIDYERGLLDCNEERIREIMDLVKLYYDPDYVEYDENKAYRLVTSYMDYGCLAENECLYNYCNDGYYSFSTVKKKLAGMGDEVRKRGNDSRDRADGGHPAGFEKQAERMAAHEGPALRRDPDGAGRFAVRELYFLGGEARAVVLAPGALFLRRRILGI